MLAAVEQAAAAHGLPRIDATNARQYPSPNLTQDRGDRVPEPVARVLAGLAPSVPINIDRPF